jgi:FKBP-type peptidyl-prolyl cis-trans isomerase FklB
MKNKNVIIVFIVLLAAGITACNGGSISGKDVKVKTETDSVAYALGHSIGNNLKSQFPDVSPEILSSALLEAFEGKENKLFESAQAADSYIRGYLQLASDRKAEENKVKGEEFLSKNAKKEGVTVTESGLQYQVITEGTGPKPTAENTVKVHYHGTTIDGEVFDSSVERGEPATFPLGGVIKGWTEGLQYMTVGSKYKFVIPADLAYGSRQAGAKIGPNSTLIFDVELLEIVE